jgi:hypothetical protein
MFCCVTGALPLSATAEDEVDEVHFTGRFCSETARLQYAACRHEGHDDNLTALAICLNFEDEEERSECQDEAAADAFEARSECRRQRAARLDLCRKLGDDRYDPDYDPELFDDDFTHLTHPNPYFPLGIGNSWDYEGDGETNRREVLDEVKLIEGVTCIVVNDLVRVDGVAKEDTDDWYAQRLDGDVDYFGEEVKDYELFEGDDPQIPELVAIDGSFKVGRDGDKPGTAFPGTPEVGKTYRQEFSAGNAEDAATILSTTYGFGDDEELDEFVPRALVELLCADHDCIVAGEVVPLDPGVFERKYYARGIGLFLEVNPNDESINQLVACNFDPRCDALPAP